MSKRSSGQRWVRLSLEDVRSRLKTIDDVKRLPDAVLDGLAKAICFTRPYPPEFGELISTAKGAINGVDRWIKKNEDDPAFRKFLREVTDRLEVHGRTVMAMMKICPMAHHEATVYYDKEGGLRGGVHCDRSNPGPERSFFGVGQSRAGDRKHLDTLLVFGMGVLTEFLDEDLRRGFEWTEVVHRRKKRSVHASELMAKVLDEFWNDDGRIGKIGDGHMPSSIRSQRKRAAEMQPSLPRARFLKILKGLMVTHAWCVSK